MQTGQFSKLTRAPGMLSSQTAVLVLSKLLQLNGGMCFCDLDSTFKIVLSIPISHFQVSPLKAVE